MALCDYGLDYREIERRDLTSFSIYASSKPSQPQPPPWSHYYLSFTIRNLQYLST